MQFNVSAFDVAIVFLVGTLILFVGLFKISSNKKSGGICKSATAHGPKLFLTFILGLSLGVVLPSLIYVVDDSENAIAPRVERSEQEELYETLSSWIQTGSSFAIDLLTETREVEARRIAERIRIFCLVIDDPKQTQKRNATKDTWGRHCNKLIFTSEVTERKKRVVEDSASQWQSVVRSFNFIGRKYLGDFDWFVRVDDETYVVVENLRRGLDQYNFEDPQRYGFHFRTLENPGTGTGYVLSRQAVKKLIDEGFSSNSKFCRNENATDVFDELEISSCLKYLNMEPIDFHGRALSFNDREVTLPRVKNKTWWMEEYDFWPYGKSPSPPKKRTSCCNRDLVSFHNTLPAKMHVIEYLIYDVQVYGAPIKGLESLTLDHTESFHY